MNSLAARKRLLISQSELSRQLLRFERLNLQQRVGDTRERLQANRWWLVGGALGVGWLITRKMPRMAAWLPMALPALRMIRSSWR